MERKYFSRGVPRYDIERGEAASLTLVGKWMGRIIKTHYELASFDSEGSVVIEIGSILSLKQRYPIFCYVLTGAISFTFIIYVA